MNFYRTTNHRKFIAIDSSTSVVIAKSEAKSSITAYLIPSFNMDGEIYEESSFSEFFSEYDKILTFITTVAELKRDEQGLKGSLKEIKN
jgi:hypothetical protein